MNKKCVILWQTLLFAVIAPAAEIATDSLQNWQLNAAALRGQTIELVDYSPEIGKLPLITVQPAVFPYLELYHQGSLVIADDAEKLKGSFTVDILADPAAPVQSIAVRVQDAAGETFQYRTPLKLRNGNWSTVTIVPENPVSVWGGNNDKKIDFPVKFRGITVDVNKNFADPVKIHIDNIKWTFDAAQK